MTIKEVDLNRELVLKKQLIRNNEYYNTQRLFDDLYRRSTNGGKFFDLMKYINDDRNILLAFGNIKKNRGSNTPGVDGKTIKDYEDMKTSDFLKLIKNKLNLYKPKPVRRVLIPKGNGKSRPLGIPCMADRIVQQCIKQVLEPICEAKFHSHSYGFRPNRSAHHALARLNYLINRGKMHYVVDVDIKGFFDNVDHGKLIKQMWHMGIRDKNFICVISKILKSEIDGVGVPSKGTPQGGILSPLLSNIVLNELDWWISNQWETNNGLRKEYSCFRGVYQAMKKTKLKQCFIVRYADDFKIVCGDYKTAQKLYIATKEWLKDRLKLDISPDKSKVTNLRKNNTEFLGFKIKASLKGKKYIANTNMSDKSIKEVKNKLKKQIRTIYHKNDRNEVNRYNAIVAGEHNYYRYATNINHNMSDINYSISKYRELKLKSSLKLTYTMSSTYKRLYGNYKSKLYSIKGITLFPVYGVTTKAPICFNQNISNYTVEGRQLVHEHLKGYGHLLRHLLLNRISDTEESAEYFDNMISKIIEQNGKDFITKELLTIGDMECHHKLPKFMGGSDEYKNLVWIKSDYHKLIHCSKTETIEYYLNKLKPNSEMLIKINKLRKLAGNIEI